MYVHTPLASSTFIPGHNDTPFAYTTHLPFALTNKVSGCLSRLQEIRPRIQGISFRRPRLQHRHPQSVLHYLENGLKKSQCNRTKLQHRCLQCSRCADSENVNVVSKNPSVIRLIQPSSERKMCSHQSPREINIEVHSCLSARDSS